MEWEEFVEKAKKYLCEKFKLSPDEVYYSHLERDGISEALIFRSAKEKKCYAVYCNSYKKKIEDADEIECPAGDCDFCSFGPE